MKTLVVAQQKGGVGKTSSLVHLAFDFLERGLRVAVIDLDTQGNASFTLQEFGSGYLASQLFDQDGNAVRSAFAELPEGPLMRLIESDPVLANMEKRSLTDAAGAFKENIKALADCGFDVVLIDTAPALGVSLAAALYAADCVLSPIELEAYSIQGIKKMLTTIANVRKLNTKLKFLGMVPSKVDARNPRHVRHQDELQAAYPQLMIPAGAAASPMRSLPGCRCGRSRRPQHARPRRKCAHWPPMFLKRWRFNNEHRNQEDARQGHRRGHRQAANVRAGP